MFETSEISIPTGKIIVLPDYFVDPRPSQQHFFAGLIERNEKLSPIFVVQHGDEYGLVDGINRLEAQKLLGRETIRAVIVDVIQVRPEEVIFKPDIYPRFDVDQERVALFADLMRHGQPFPLIFTTRTEEGYTLLDGKYRLDAMKQAGLTKINIAVLPRPKDMLFAVVRFNNFSRSGVLFTKEDIREVVLQGLENGLNIETIAGKLEYPVSWVQSLVQHEGGERDG